MERHKLIKKELVTVDPAILKPYGGNPRHNNKSAQMVAESIKQYGYINPIVIDENNVILAGNTRFKAINILGFQSVEVLRVSGLSEKQKNGFVIADNKVGEFSKWNYAALERMLADGELDNEGLEQFGILSVKRQKEKLEELIYGYIEPHVSVESQMNELVSNEIKSKAPITHEQEEW